MSVKRFALRLSVCVLLALLVAACGTAALATGLESPAPDTGEDAGLDAVLDAGSDTDAFPFNLLSGLLGLADDPEGATTTVEIILLLTVLTLVPSILVLMTAFTRIVIVLSFTRNAMGTQQTPPNQVVIGLALFLTFMVMAPVFNEILTEAWEPYQREEISISEAMEGTVRPLRQFMIEQIYNQKHQGDLVNFLSISGHTEPVENFEDIPTHVLIPAFITSEIKTAFRMGFILFIPFIVIDMVVASALMSMGMMMLPPVMISLPFKIMLFVMVDGWNLVVGSLVKTFSP